MPDTPRPPAQVVITGPARTTQKVRRSTSHTFHLIMSICTAGMWAVFVWWPLTWWHRFGPRKKVTQRHYY